MTRKCTGALLGVLGLMVVGVASAKADSSPSVLFSPQDVQGQEAEVRAAPLPPLPNEPGCLTLDALLFNNPRDWTLWINGERWTPAKNRVQADVQVLDVHPDAAHVRLMVPEVGERTVWLTPGETYHPLLDRVTRGRGGASE